MKNNAKKSIFLENGDSILYGDASSICYKNTDLVMGLGGSADMPSILLPSYLLGGVEMLLEEGASNKLNVFIAANLAASINSFCVEKSQEVAEKTKEFLVSFLAEFYPKILKRVDISIDNENKSKDTLLKAESLLNSCGDQLIDLLSDTEKLLLLRKSAKYQSSYDSNILEKSNLLYPFCHPLYEGMLDGERSMIKIGGRAESLFNTISTKILQLNSPYYKDMAIAQRITKSGKVPLYYAMNGEPKLGEEYSGNFNDIEKVANMRQFDCDIVSDRIGESLYLERYNDCLVR